MNVLNIKERKEPEEHALIFRYLFFKETNVLNFKERKEPEEQALISKHQIVQLLQTPETVFRGRTPQFQL